MAPAKPQLTLSQALDGTMHVGYDRTDLPLFHVIASPKPGTTFKVSSHWPCAVCAQHAFSEQDFAKQWSSALKDFGTRTLQ